MQCSTLLGEGRAIVDVEFTIVDADEMIIVSVDFENTNVLPCLTEDQVNDLEDACWKAAHDEAQEARLYRGQVLYEERMAA